MKSAAFFDLDGVLLRGESQLAFLAWCWRRRILPRGRSLRIMVEYAGYRAGFHSDARRLRAAGYALLRGVAAKHVDDAATEFVSRQIRGRFRRHAVSILEWHRAQQRTVVLVTSAGEPIARPVAESLAADGVVATRLIQRGGLFTGACEQPEPYFTGKRLLVERFCAERGLSLAHSFAYADHESDLPLLECMGHPIAANPTRKLRRIAAERGWRVVDLDAEGAFGSS
jgi:HAD superfamily hydrolase (TIGR01490 family)